MEVDLRSSDPNSLDRLDRGFQRGVRQALEDENGRWKQSGRLTISVEKVGDRPAGRTPADSPIVQTAVAVGKAVGLTAVLEEGSTDANVPMNLGVPAITVGSGGTSFETHTLQETFDTTDSWRGTQRILLLTIALAR
jgi:tripeptide aminopeptidase